MRALAALLLIAAINTAAPADRYFGKLKMSALRIRYEITQLKIDYEYHRRMPDDVLHLLTYTEDAYYQWAAAYPKDAWLPSTGYNLAKLFEDLPGYGARDGAVRALQFVRAHFKNTRYSKASLADLRRGVPIKPEPAWAVPATPTAAPSALRSPSLTPTPSPAPLQPRPKIRSNKLWLRGGAAKTTFGATGVTLAGGAAKGKLLL
jgi:hypothetical protein